MTLSPDFITAARQLVEAATAGPWHVNIHLEVSNGHRVVALQTHHHKNKNDAAFIAAARTLVPQLLDEVERLRDLACTSDEVGDFQAMRQGYREMRAERDRYRDRPWERLRELGFVVQQNENTSDGEVVERIAAMVLRRVDEVLHCDSKDALTELYGDIRAGLWKEPK